MGINKIQNQLVGLTETMLGGERQHRGHMTSTYRPSEKKALSMVVRDLSNSRQPRNFQHTVVFQPPFLPVLTLSHLVLVVCNLCNQTRPARQSPVEVSRPRNRRVLNV